MSETTTENTATATAASNTESTETGSQSTAAETGTQAAATAGTSDAEHALGDAGKKALDAMKADRNQARDDLKALRAEFDAFKAKADGKEAEHAAAIEAQRVKDEALAAANARILSAEVRASAAGKLADPQDALRFIDLSSFEVADDGSVDGSAITAAIEDLIKTKPYLAVQDGKRFQGTADAGARNESAPSIDQQIAEATKAGDHARAIALKRQKAYADH